jgi:nucleoside 2-deoxyribosyltransferase
MTMNTPVRVIHVVGGIYNEVCLNPPWRETFGSAGRAAQAMAEMGISSVLYGYANDDTSLVVQSRAHFGNYKFERTKAPRAVTFAYEHGLSTPHFSVPDQNYPPISISVTGEMVVRFGMVEPNEAVVHADYAVYDPQNSYTPKLFSANGSTAKHLAIVLNRTELGLLTGGPTDDIEKAVSDLVKLTSAEIVVVKMGPKGAVVYDSGQFSVVPAFHTTSVWKIGSGDNFVAHFAIHWMMMKATACEAAKRASRATAFYCQHQGFMTPATQTKFDPAPINPSQRYLDGYKPKVYLAGPFFTMAERWLIGQARDSLIHMGMEVFSPYHDVGHGCAGDVVGKDLAGIDSCDVVFAVGDGLDSGTIFEIGYARAKGKNVVLYSENESDGDKKMMEGSDCLLCPDFVSAIYLTVWAGIEA